MIPALDHGSRPLRMLWPVPGPLRARTRPLTEPLGVSPVNEVTWTVMLPFPASGWRTK